MDESIEANELRKLYPEYRLLELIFPLPPASLRSNSRAHWARKMRDKVAYSRDVYASWMVKQERFEGGVIASASVLYVWRFSGAVPDLANIGANLKALQDFLCFAPDNGRQRNDCHYLGIIRDDRQIRPIFRAMKVAKRSDECVQVLIAAETMEDEHAFCAQDFHRCDGGGPGEYARYVTAEPPAQ